jgi:hypothetical protein
MDDRKPHQLVALGQAFVTTCPLGLLSWKSMM